MSDVATKIIEILKEHARASNKTMSRDTKMADLEIDSLDLAVVVFDIEDAFGIEIPYDDDDDLENLATVGLIFEKVQALLAESRKAA
ncbi:MAG: phosphopantetheine-binding protein [Hyphomicrobiaceae bacterium]|nr:phosphopantetheine-binding protein [Hyphomicrobiaceae bacterium]